MRKVCVQFFIQLLLLVALPNGTGLFAQSSNGEDRSDTAVRAAVDFDKLSVGGKYLVTVKSRGCFHSTDLQLTVTRKTDGYRARFQMAGKISGVKVKDRRKAARLSLVQLDAIKTFEAELVRLSKVKYGCTTEDEFSVSVDGQKQTYSVDNCNWNGFGKLIGMLFRR